MPKRIAISAAAPERSACPATPSNRPMADSTITMPSGSAADSRIAAMWPGDMAQLSMFAHSAPLAAL